MSGVLVVMEQRASAWHRMSWETLAAGQQLAAQTGLKVYGAVIGHGVGAAQKEALAQAFAVAEIMRRRVRCLVGTGWCCRHRRSPALQPTT